jgi:hypothetical protein
MYHYIKIETLTIPLNGMVVSGTGLQGGGKRKN